MRPQEKEQTPDAIRAEIERRKERAERINIKRRLWDAYYAKRDRIKQ
jgi:hypothetical protein